MSFLSGLKWETLKQLREIVHRTVLKDYPPWMRTDHEADKIIEAQGPAAMERAYKDFIDWKVRGS